MRKIFTTFAICMACVVGALPIASQSEDKNIRFSTLDIYLETAEPLAAWQFELSELTGQMLVVGVENGESTAFEGAPYYDLEAVKNGTADRIIVADFTLSPASALSTGKIRIATVHIQLSGSAVPDYALRLVAAGDAEGNAIQAMINFEIH